MSGVCRNRDSLGMKFHRAPATSTRYAGPARTFNTGDDRSRSVLREAKSQKVNHKKAFPSMRQQPLETAEWVGGPHVFATVGRRSGQGDELPVMLPQANCERLLVCRVKVARRGASPQLHRVIETPGSAGAISGGRVVPWVGSQGLGVLRDPTARRIHWGVYGSVPFFFSMRNANWRLNDYSC